MSKWCKDKVNGERSQNSKIKYVKIGGYGTHGLSHWARTLQGMPIPDLDFLTTVTAFYCPSIQKQVLQAKGAQ